MPKPRLLIPVFTHFSVRYILRTGMLKSLTDFVQPIIALSWQDEALENEFIHQSAEVVQVPDFTLTDRYRNIREMVNFWHKLYRQTNTTEIDLRRERSLMDLKDRFYYDRRINAYRKAVEDEDKVQALLQEEERLFWEETNHADFDALLELTHPDFIFSITPFVNKEEPLLRCAQKRNIPRFTSILSFDNVTTRTRLPVPFSHYLVWNKYNQAELLRIYPEIKPETITISGAPQFDFYYDPTYITDEMEWRKDLNLPADRPVILFGGGTYRIVPHEPLLLKELDDAITGHQILNDPIILFRRHPGDIASRWEKILNSARNVWLDKSWQANESKGQINITSADIKHLCSTLKYCAVHINASSTLSVDGAVFDRPQVGPAYDPGFLHKYNRILRELYEREHYLPITCSGGLAVVNSRREYLKAINEGFSDPEERADGRKKIVSEICTFNDGHSTQRVVDTLKRLVG